MKAAEARAAWDELTDVQRVALGAVWMREKIGKPATSDIFGETRGQTALATRTLRALVALGLLKHWEGCQTVYAVTDAARELVRAADAETTRKIRRVLAARRRAAAREAGDG